VGADIWVKLLFGAAFAPRGHGGSASLATTFALMYVGIIYAITLMMLERRNGRSRFIAFGRPRGQMWCSIWCSIRPGIAMLGDGGGGMSACALSVLGNRRSS